MNSNTIELYTSDTTDLDVERCRDCGSIDFEITDTRKFCVYCGLVSHRVFTSGTTMDLTREWPIE